MPRRATARPRCYWRPLTAAGRDPLMAPDVWMPQNGTPASSTAVARVIRTTTNAGNKSCSARVHTGRFNRICSVSIAQIATACCPLGAIIGAEPKSVGS